MSSPERTASASVSPMLSPQRMVKSGLCIGCGTCMAESGDGAAMHLDRYGQLKPDRSNNPAGFAELCPFSPHARSEDQIALARFGSARFYDSRIGRFEAAYVGHVLEGSFRVDGSSGGMASWTAAELLRRKLVDAVAHVVPREGDGERLFRYQLSRTAEDLRKGAKSRYHPVELSGVVAEMKRHPGRYAVVGIPCFIKALHLLSLQDPALRERLAFTLGLFCGHMKSTRFVESFAWQMGTDMNAVAGVDYRLKDPRRPANWYTALLRLKDGSTRSKDWWHLVDGDWGAGFFQNSACNFCDDVVAETADISFGDAWVEPYSSDGLGTNVVIVRSPLLQALVADAVKEGRLELREVDSDFIVETQAAGFRQRREGLAFRLAWPRSGVQPRKRVAPAWKGLPARRMLVYGLRSAISAASHRVFWFARTMKIPAAYIHWASAMLALYQGVTYSRGWIGKLVDGVSMRGRKRSKDEGSKDEGAGA
ncbi:Coenzyme F420 hydrogenase/dehydrogenase, beta subunit C-terminal domain [Sinorhizobium medicae]|uniref:Coenzyme F420 hydrogenase/dehydrogenase, beta subunit C-terminal domain n=1 Tax=Sinorhizobium medicae TaxID=110321 RepID=UPI00119A2A51|nr:Coenzyme F420 hydrogenase/dehydrogenase, beta subunit C-terminal domain [Sinorhizobium medicae]TWA21273.1 coenzyme F420-reducing hydrogenase beta subunit [Sinorhizobium medicae]TWA29633.1 coenzyme F420-reducing hydrogenase beta subunit [Sinorhizobium medicae]TWA41178.1 coenzyme F420-reducing hydrogenase beta subunit [Sinorhizobium medicae]